MKDPNEFTVQKLKDKLRQMNLSTGGTKAELIVRLSHADPSGRWIVEIGADPDNVTEEEAIAVNVDVGTSEQRAVGPLAPNEWKRELEFASRERELLQREIELMRRENEQLRAAQLTPDVGIRAVTSKINLTNLKEMLPMFDGKKGSSYQCWKEQLMMVKQMYQLDDNMTKLLLGAKLTGNAAEWLHSVPAHLSMTVDELLSRMETLYERRENRLGLRKEFESRAWQHGETFAEYCHKKIVLANKVPIAENEMVDYLIDGIPSRSIKHQALMQQFPDKETMLKAMENISLGSDQKPTCKTEKVPATRSTAKASGLAKKSEDESSTKQEMKCFNCNIMGHIAAKCQMPRREKGACFKCLQLGHKAADCPSKNPVKKEVHKNENEKKTDINSVFNGETGDFRRKVNYRIVGETGDYGLTCILDTLLDTGSPVSFVKDSFVPPYLISSMLPDDDKYRGLNDSALEVKGRITVQMSLNKMKPKYVSLLVVSARSMKASVVIGRDVLRQFFEKEEITGEAIESQMIQEILNIEIQEEKPGEALKINPNLNFSAQKAVQRLFSEGYVTPDRPSQPQVEAELRLRLKEDKPFNFSVRRPSYAEKKELRSLLDSLLEQGIIRSSESEYASPIVLVRKKTGDLRLCVDYRELNKLLLKDNYPLPNIEDLIDSLHEKKFFSKLDLKNGFYHIKMSEDSVKYTAFTTPFGQFEFLRMPFGLKVAPPRFQRFINQALSKLIRELKLLVYMDDILVISNTVEQHLEILKEVFEILVKNKLELRVDKCMIMYTELEFVGYLVSEQGIRPTGEGIKSVQRIPVPRNIKEVHSFVALCSYFRKFIASFSQIAKPLYDMLKKHSQYNFGVSELYAFEELKKRLTNAPVLAIYNPSNETELHCDASNSGFGAVLMQRGKDNQFHPVFFFSKRTTEVESRYHSFELEMLAIVYALRRFRVYLNGIKFKIVTDCNALTLAFKKKEISPRINRWVLELLDYDYVAEHRPGTKMKHVDALSRTPTDVLLIEDNSFELNLALSQARDNKLRKLKDLLQGSNDSQFEMRNGIVFKKHEGELLFFVPQAMEQQVLHKYHDQMGHLGVDKTFANVLKSYWFPDLKQKVKEYVFNCLKCISFSPVVGKKEGYLHCIPKGQVPFEMFHVDHYGPIDKDRREKRYLLVVIDAFTKFVKLYPTKTTSTQEVINQLTIHFNNFSRPRMIISDRGTAFTSGDFELFCKNNNIQHVRTATHSPKANGQVERVNRVLGPMISKLVENDEKKYWYNVLSDIEFAINNSTHKMTNETPSKLLFGVEQRGEIVDAIREYLVNKNVSEDRDLLRLRARASEKIKRNQRYNKEYFDKRRKPAHKYKLGDSVMIKNVDTTVGASHKIIPKFKGPYEVTRVLRNDRYVVKDARDHQVTQKPYEGTWEAANMRPWARFKNSEGGVESELAECNNIS